MKQQQKKKNYVKSPIVGIKLRIDAIKKQIPNMVNKRLSMLSSDENRFNQAKPIYQQALNQAGHKHTLVYNKPDDDAKRK